MAVWLVVALVVIGAPLDDTGASKRGELRAEAETILEERRNLEISSQEALRRVELLLRALRAWAADSGLELTHHSRAYSAEAHGGAETMTADNCPLFYKEDIEEEDDVCPLDLTRSEVWGVSVMYCRYHCAPPVDE